MNQKWTRMLSFGKVWKFHPGVWSSWLSWTLERYYEGWESGGKGAQKYGKRETLAPLSPPTTPPPFLGVTKKKLSSFYSQRITCIAQESEARNRNTSIRSQIILEFWNIWSLNLSFFAGNWSKLPLIREFWSPVGKSGRLTLYKGDTPIIRGSWHIWN